MTKGKKTRPRDWIQQGDNSQMGDNSEMSDNGRCGKCKEVTVLMKMQDVSGLLVVNGGVKRRI